MKKSLILLTLFLLMQNSWAQETLRLELGKMTQSVRNFSSQAFDDIDPRGIAMMGHVNFTYTLEPTLEWRKKNKKNMTTKPGTMMGIGFGYGIYRGELTTCDIPEYYRGTIMSVQGRFGGVWRFDSPKTEVSKVNGKNVKKLTHRYWDLIPYGQVSWSKRQGTVLLGGGTHHDTTFVEPTVGHIALTFGAQIKVKRIILDLGGMPKIGKTPGVWNVGLRYTLWSRKFVPDAIIRTPRFRY